MAKQLGLTRLQTSKVYELAHREQLRWEALLKILLAAKIRDLWKDEEKCLPRFLQKKDQEGKVSYIPQCEICIKTYRDIALMFAGL